MAWLDIFTQKDKGHCRSCGAAVTWATLVKSGKRMPFDGHELTPVQTKHRPDGELIEVIDSAINTSHFATCPQKNTWRRK